MKKLKKSVRKAASTKSATPKSTKHSAAAAAAPMRNPKPTGTGKAAKGPDPTRKLKSQAPVTPKPKPGAKRGATAQPKSVPASSKPAHSTKSRAAVAVEPAKPKTPKKAASAQPKKVALPGARKAKRSLRIPPILMEGDLAPLSPAMEPSSRYVVGPDSPGHGAAMRVGGGVLPEAYGTRKLFLTARDPHWLYAHWDFTRAQMVECNALSARGHMALRIYLDALEGQVHTEVPVYSESRNWFVHVGLAGARYIAELGYYEKQAGKWMVVSTSGATVTPPDSLSADTSFEPVTIPPDLPSERLVELVKSAVAESVPLAKAVAQLREQGHVLPQPTEFTEVTWTRQQERALAKVISMDEVHRVWLGSIEITELVRRQLVKELPTGQITPTSPPAPWEALGSISSPFGAAGSVSSPFGRPGAKGRAFWFNVNAELIIYGATEPDAQVSLGGRIIRLRPDGSFSYRFALPDGEYALEAIATAADGAESRSADLHFARATLYQGEVEAHPQDPALKSPRTENLD